MLRTSRRAAASLLSLLVAWSTGASAADYPFSARFDWWSEGEITQVWFHREFHGRLLQSAPITLDAGSVLRDLLGGIRIECMADTSIGLPNWSVTTGVCTLSRENGAVTIEVIECAGTQKLCEGNWRITSGTGDFAHLTGSGTVEGHLVEPDPLPWTWNGPTAGFNILSGFITIP